MTNEPYRDRVEECRQALARMVWNCDVESLALIVGFLGEMEDWDSPHVASPFPVVEFTLDSGGGLTGRVLWLPDPVGTPAQHHPTCTPYNQARALWGDYECCWNDTVDPIPF